MVKLKQIIYPGAIDIFDAPLEEPGIVDNGLLMIDGVTYSKNIIKNEFCYVLSIYATPGTKVLLGDNDSNIIQINGTGVFNMDFGQYPIRNIRLRQPEGDLVYPIVFDIQYIGLNAEKEE